MVPLTRLHEYRPKRQLYSPHSFHEGRHHGDLLENMGRRRLLGHERQLQVTDDPVDRGSIRKEGDDIAEDFKVVPIYTCGLAPRKNRLGLSVRGRASLTVMVRQQSPDGRRSVRWRGWSRSNLFG